MKTPSSDFVLPGDISKFSIPISLKSLYWSTKMNIIEEVDKLLQSFLPIFESRGRAIITLPELKPIDIDQLKIGTRVRYQPDVAQRSSNLRSNKCKRLLPASWFFTEKGLESDRFHRVLSTDLLFLNDCREIFLQKVVDSSSREMSAKLLICDEDSYEILAKMNYILASGSYSIRSSINLMYKEPYNVTAFFLLSEVLELFENRKEPIIFRRNDPKLGREAFIFNYGLIRKTLPYLKMCELVILLKDQVFDPSKTNVLLKATKEQVIIEYLANFARESRLISLKPFDQNLGQTHPIYNNVLIVNSSVCRGGLQTVYGKPTMNQLLLQAEHLVNVSNRLFLNLRSITYRIADPYGQTKVFADLVETSIKSGTRDDHVRGARVLVLDRFCDIQSALVHAELYGPFVEQEFEKSAIDEVNSEFRTYCTVTVDDLDEKLQLVSLTEVIGVIISHSSKLRPTTTSGNEAETRPLKSAMATSQSTRRHLAIVKRIYRSLHEGYLLITRLESSILSMGDELRQNAADNFRNTQQNCVADRFQRVSLAFKKLFDASARAVECMDLIRLTCIMVDLINMIEHLTTGSSSPGTCKILLEARKIINESKEFIKLLKPRSGSKNRKFDSARGLKIIDAFDNLSKTMGRFRSIPNVTTIIESFIAHKLDPKDYRTVQLSRSKLNLKETPILVFIGPITPEELGRIKALESKLMGNKSLDMMCVFLHGLCRPEDFLMSLTN